MTDQIPVATVEDIDLDLFERVARHRAVPSLTPALRAGIARRRNEFLAYVEKNRDRHLYGITTRHHVGVKTVLREDDFDEYSSRLPASGASFEPFLPDHVTRGIVVARLADIFNGTGCVGLETLDRVIAMLDEEKLPPVPERGCGEPGDIIPLGQLFREHLNGTLEVGEGMAIINGSPVAAALLADAAIAGRHHATMIERAFALAATAIGAPAEHFASFFDQAWRDPHQALTLQAIRAHLDGSNTTSLAYQAPVSFRSAPRLFGWLRRTQASAEDLATTALRASSNNPAFVGPEVIPPHGAIYSNGGYHQAYASPTLDALTRSRADASQLFGALCSRVAEGAGGLLALESEAEVSTLYHTATGWAEEARAAAAPTLITLANGGQTDTGTLDLLAWRRSRDAAVALENLAAVLAVLAAHTVAHRGVQVGPSLVDLQDAVLERFPVGTRPVAFAEGLDRVRSVVTRPTEGHAVTATPG